MVPTQSESSLRRALTIAGTLGLLGAATMLPVAIGLAFGRPGGGVAFVFNTLPTWVSYQTLSQAGIFAVLAGALCALLLVAGRWPVRVFVLLAAALFMYGDWAFSTGGYWRAQMAVTFDATPYYFFIAGRAAVLTALSVLALVAAVRLKRPHAEAAITEAPPA
jgi:hypothetical protein